MLWIAFPKAIRSATKHCRTLKPEAKQSLDRRPPIVAAIQSARAEVFKVLVTTPSADKELAFSEALSLGTVTGNINWV
jgi:hypothetical protein